MFQKGEIKRHLLGCLEIALFMRQGAGRFGSSSGEMWRSFLVALASVPFIYMAVYYIKPTEPPFEGLSFGFVIFLFTARLILVTGLFLLLSYAILRGFERGQYFIQFVTAYNWVGVISAVLFLPVLWLLFTGAHTWEEVEPAVFVLAIYEYFYVAFMTTFVMRVPWQLAGFITICGLALNQTSLEFLLWLGQKIGTATATL